MSIVYIVPGVRCSKSADNLSPIDRIELEFTSSKRCSSIIPVTSSKQCRPPDGRGVGGLGGRQKYRRGGRG